jgi:hypothetical protein
MHKMAALSRGEAREVLLLGSPWHEHLPGNTELQKVLAVATRELVRRMGAAVRKHAMVMVRVSPDETFEQLVAGSNPQWNATTLCDVRAAQEAIAVRVRSATDHPFPSASHTVTAPPFFDENEVVIAAISADIVGFVEGLKARG